MDSALAALAWQLEQQPPRRPAGPAAVRFVGARAGLAPLLRRQGWDPAEGAWQALQTQAGWAATLASEPDWQLSAGVRGWQPGGAVSAEAVLEEPPEAQPHLVLLLPPRGREASRGALARAWLALAGGGELRTALRNDQGARSLERDLACLSPTLEVASKHHCRVLRAVRGRADEGLAQAREWQAQAAPRADADGDWSEAGVFAHGRLDAGSALLIEQLPDRLAGGRVADLGAGTGALAAAVLARARAPLQLDLYELEARALALAARRLAPAVAAGGHQLQLYWQDLRGGLGPRDAARGYDLILSNPPFHVDGREDLGLGLAFLRAAAAALHPQGSFWLVANRHLPYAETLKACFGELDSLAETAQYRVLRARRPRR
ncbi:MAG TPA: methyltransferase [Nevskiaceae bacterium]|nr:methyltransferase [Nevskiaceae bacterium]